LARHAQLVAIDLGLDLELGLLEAGHEPLGGGLFDALSYRDLAACFTEVNLALAKLDAARVDAARRQAQPQDVEQLVELVFALRELRDLISLGLEESVGAAQVVALGHLAISLVDRIG